MSDLKIEYINIKDIKPYKRNAKKHPQAQIDQIAASIKEFGMNDPIAVSGPDNTIVEGHGRYIACMQLEIPTVPILRLDHLSDEQRRAYNLVHNKLCMNSDFSLSALSKELDNIFDIDMSNFGFNTEVVKDDYEKQSLDMHIEKMFRTCNVLNMQRAVYPGVGKYDIPEILPVTDLPEVTQWVRFTDTLHEKEPEGKGVHFFQSDYEFERIWKKPEAYIEVLSKFAVVAAPDFSPYTDMPFALHIYNHYRKHWVARYLQENGIPVIPTIRRSQDLKDEEFYLDGEPRESIIMVSFQWDDTSKSIDDRLYEYNHVYDNLKPSHLYVYGKILDEMRGNKTLVPYWAKNIFKESGKNGKT